MTATWRAERPWLEHCIVSDSTLPWTETFLPPGADLAAVLARFRAAGLDHVSLTAAAGKDSALEALSTLARLRAAVAADAGLVLATDRAAMTAARAAGQLSVSFHFQTTTPFLDDLDLIEPFRALGVTRALLAYNERNAAADGCHEPANAGLSALGRRVVAGLGAAGLLLDLSHCGERTSLEAIDLVTRPPLISHSNARALYDHERNISDAQIKACAARGGWIGVNGVGFFLADHPTDLAEAMSRQLAYMAELVGPEHLGLGLDFMYLEGSDYGFYRRAPERWPRGYPPPPWDFFQPEDLPALVAALEARGFSQGEVRGILGDNYLRVTLGEG